MGVMKKRLIGCLAFVALAAAGAAMAADMPVKAPVYQAPVVPVWSWTGSYIGINAGYSVGRDPTTPGETYDLFGFARPINTSSFDLAPAGALIGGQLGYNWQTRNWVFGLEGDIQWSGQKDTYCGVRCTNLGINQSVFITTIEQRLNWFGTVRGRLGYAAGPALFYVTGGAASGGITTNVTETIFADPTAAVSFSHTKVGYAVGGGVEAALNGNWTAKVEYLYMSLGSTTDSFPYTGPNTGTANNVITSDLRDHIFRAGVNYRFGQGSVTAADNPIGMSVKAPVPAQVYNWTGFYLGINAGYGVGRNPTTATVAFPGAGPQFTANDQFTLSPAGGLIGGQLGYNWQTGHIVFGLEGDIEWTGEKDTACVSYCRPNAGPNGAVSTAVEQKLASFGTVRGRLGYAAGPALFYVTGGAAWAEVKTDSTGLDGGGGALLESIIANFSRTKGGYALGGGVEAALGGNWTAKAEYLYLNLGSATDGPFTCCAATGPAVRTISYDMRDHIFRAGLNYKFNWGSVVAKN
jgi:outer membrane immunogenic protein